MIAAVDSAMPPTATQVAAAKAGGIQVWSGYLASKSGVGLLRPWTQAEFDVARGCGGTPIAFCSGNDNPTDCRNLAQAWSVRLCLDVESGIRGDGPWVQPWLNSSGAGLYGNLPVFMGRTAPFFIVAAYPGSDPGRTWPNGSPSVPHGWQWQGTTSMFGASVDRSWLDDYFLGEPDMTPAEVQAQIDASLGPLNAELDNLMNRHGMALYWHFLGRTWDDAWLNVWKPKFKADYRSALTEFRNTDEAKAYRNSGKPDTTTHPNVQDASGWPDPAIQGGGLVPHRHPFTATTGQPV